MSKRVLIITAVLYSAAFILVSWACLAGLRTAGLTLSTGLFGLSAVCFGIAAVLNIIRILRMNGEKREREAKR